MAKKTDEKKQPVPMGGDIPETTSNAPVTRNPRTARAILTLVAEVEKMFPGIASEVGNYSMFNVATEVTFDCSDEPEVAELLSLVAGDDRIMEVLNEEGQIWVAFRSNLRTQDTTTPFGLKDALAVLRGSE